MHKNHILPSENETFGFWGESKINRYENVEGLWKDMSLLLMDVFNASPEVVRQTLDSRFGRHLADELSFVKGGKVTPETAVHHAIELLKRSDWRKYFRKAIHDSAEWIENLKG